MNKKDAVKLITECFQLHERILGPRHPDTLSLAAARVSDKNKKSIKITI
jgi:hypothetical protein